MDVEDKFPEHIYRPSVATLEELEPEMRGGYVPAGDGGYKLHPVLEADAKRHREEWEQTVADRNAQKAELEATLVRRRAQLKRILVDAELRKTLEAAKVVALDHSIIVAAMNADLSPVLRELEDGTDVVEVDRPDGPFSLGHAATEWLASPKGDKLRPPPPPVEGPFLRLVREIGAA